MKKYLEKVRSLISVFNNFDIQQISKMENARANLLSKLATLAPNELPKEVFFEALQHSSSEEPQAIMKVDYESS